MTLRVLAVSPRFAPTNGADTHRLRLLLPHASAAGWQVTVLAVDSADVVGPVDPWLTNNLPSCVPVHRVRGWNISGWGLNGLAQRSLWPLYRKGCELLATGSFDLVFFSTTEFTVHVLGPVWKRKFGIPFCMDYQDPWVNDYYRNHADVTPPGGRIKYAVASLLDHMMERFVVRGCSGYLAVSQAYLADLEDRYGVAIRGKPTLVQPFPAEPDEIVALGENACIDVRPGAKRVWRYIGRGGPDMIKAVSAFFQSWRQAVADNIIADDAVRFEAYGTSYAEAGKGEKTFEPVAAAAGMTGQVRENSDRVGYSDMLRMLFKSDALVVFGSDDPAYTASKIYPYLLAKKPLLAIFHESSSVVKLMREVGGGVCITFNKNTPVEILASMILHSWFKNRGFETSVVLDLDSFEPYTASCQAKKICAWFRQVLRRPIDAAEDTIQQIG